MAEVSVLDGGAAARRRSAMKVIGVGLGRTGTLSLKVALERLGLAPCYHMLEVFEHPEHVALWAAAAAGGPPDWEGLFGRYQATTDWPGAAFWRSLAAAYPEAKLLLTVRDPGRWYESVLHTVYQVSQSELGGPAEAMPPGLRQFRDLVDAVVWQGTFGGRFGDRDHAIEVFRRHREEVERSVAPERLLVFDVADGWEPLCAFLGAAVPDGPFPHLNDTASFHARVVGGGGAGMLDGRSFTPPHPGPPPPRGRE